MAEIEQLLADDRLVTLTGAGGCGKTRLALQVAAGLLEACPDGIWFVDLAPLTDPELVPQTVATALGLQEAPGRPPAQRLRDYLEPRHLLLVLDNCEHLIEACAHLVQGLLQRCPQVRVLATSREALGIAGERCHRVPPLSLPAPGCLPTLAQLTQYEAVRLFIERAVAVQAAFEVTAENAPAVAEICRRLDGIPLAIELAAARVTVVSVEQIARRLDDRFRLLTEGSRTALPRQQTLRALIDWSYDLLSETERAVLRRLSVAAGGWTLAAVEAVCGGTTVGCQLSAVCEGSAVLADSRQPTVGSPGEVLGLLARLIGKSLVAVEAAGGRENGWGSRAVGLSTAPSPPVPAEPRYRLLETVRQYSQGRLREAGEEERTRRCHRDFFLALAEEVEPRLHGPEQGVWLDRLEAEHDHLRAALDTCQADEAGAADGLRLAGALWWFWLNRGYFGEGRLQLARALSRSSQVSPALRPKALQGAAYLAYAQGDVAAAESLGEEGLAAARQAGDRWRIAFSLFQLGLLAADYGEPQRGTMLAEESLALAREIGDNWLIAYPLMALAKSARERGDYEEATRFLEESLALARQVSDDWTIAMRLMNLGVVAQCQEEYPRAETLYREGLALCWTLKNQRGIANCLEALAALAGVRGRAEQVVRLSGAVQSLVDAVSLPRAYFLRELRERQTAAARASLGAEAFAAAWAEGRRMPLEQAVCLALEESEIQTPEGKSL